MNKRGMEIAWGMLVPIIIALVVIAVMVYIGPKGIFGGAKQFDDLKACGASFALVGGKEGKCNPGDSCSGLSKDGYYFIKFGNGGAPYCETGSVCCLAIPNSDNPPSKGDIENANRGTVCPESSRDGCQGQVGTYLYTSSGLPGKCVYELLDGQPQACWKCPTGTWRRSADNGYTMICNTDTQMTKCNAQSTGGCKYGLLLKNYLPGSATLDDICVFENLDRNREATCWKCNPGQTNCGSGVDTTTKCEGADARCDGQGGIYLYDYQYTSATTNPSCVFESTSGGEGLCWPCNVNSPLCGRTAGDGSPTVRCNSQSGTCANQYAVKYTSYRPLPGKTAACVYNTIDSNGLGVCKKCDTTKTNCGMV